MNTRLCDLDLRDYVQLMYTTLGDDFIRSHCAITFVYLPSGYWSVFDGVVPEGTLEYLKHLLLFAEGLIRALPDHAKDAQGITDAAFRKFTNVHQFEWEAMVQDLVHRARSLAQPPAGDEGDAPDPFAARGEADAEGAGGRMPVRLVLHPSLGRWWWPTLS